MRFPRTKFVDENTLYQQIDHVQSEVDEVHKAACNKPVDFDHLAKELWDVIGSAETALRMLAEKYRVDIYAARDSVITGNDKRGYYSPKGGGNG